MTKPLTTTDFDEIFDQVLEELFSDQNPVPEKKAVTSMQNTSDEDIDVALLREYFSDGSRDTVRPEFDERVYEVAKRVFLRILTKTTLN